MYRLGDLLIYVSVMSKTSYLGFVLTFPLGVPESISFRFTGTLIICLVLILCFIVFQMFPVGRCLERLWKPDGGALEFVSKASEKARG